MFLDRFLPFLYTSHTISYTTSYVKCTISYINLRYRIRYRIKCTISYVFGQVLAIFLYDVAYDIVYQIAMSYTICPCSSLLYDIVWQYRMPRRYYTISHVNIAKNIRCYRTMSHTIFLTSTWTGVCGGSHWSCPWRTHRSCLMILGPPRWSVLYHHSPDALSLSLACATANVSGDSRRLVQAKMGISSWNPVALRVTRWHRGAKWLNGRVDGLLTTQVAHGPVAPPVAANWASDCW
jgi:hypothetical protein